MNYSVKLGETFTVELVANATTGYRWQLAEPLNPNLLEYVQDGYNTPKDSNPGTGGIHTWTFKALSKGVTKITMKYVRHREQNINNPKMTVFEVEID